MTNQEIIELMDRFERSSLYSMKLAAGEWSLELSRGACGPSAPVSAAHAKAEPVSQQASAADEVITSPLAGVFYIALKPGAQPYVRAGETV